MGSRYITTGIARILTDPKLIHAGTHAGVRAETDKGEEVFLYTKAREMIELGWRKGASVYYNGIRQNRLFSRLAWIKVDTQACKEP